MYKLFYLLNLVSLAVCQGNAQSPSNNLPMSPTQNTLLWEISGNGLEKPSYFLGTMHALCPEDAYLSKSVLEILDQVEAIYFEIDLDNMTQMLGAIKAMAMRNDTTLSDLLTPEELTLVKEKLLSKLPLPFAMVQRYKPMLLSGMLAEQILPCKAGSGTEMLLIAEAKKRSLKTEGLETAAYQAGLFDSIPYEQQAKELIKALEGGQDQSGVVKKMLVAFQQQDLNAIEAITTGEEGEMVEFLDLLIFNRNRNWVALFEGIASKGPHLFAVGAGHLPGESGVLKLLEKQGYTLTPILNVKPE
jgi:uncharacterized protein YbaP (TraB family)